MPPARAPGAIKRKIAPASLWAKMGFISTVSKDRVIPKRFIGRLLNID